MSWATLYEFSLVTLLPGHGKRLFELLSKVTPRPVHTCLKAFLKYQVYLQHHLIFYSKNKGENPSGTVTCQKHSTQRRTNDHKKTLNTKNNQDNKHKIHKTHKPVQQNIRHKHKKKHRRQQTQEKTQDNRHKHTEEQPAQNRQRNKEGHRLGTGSGNNTTGEFKPVYGAHQTSLLAPLCSKVTINVNKSNPRQENP